ncbi:carbohydrate ABC transporter permease, partial [Candidatus Sumerlaeota bacterium]|nr:carbohydrate ABC transporter permease [Candidatus Sumerlaeota bacterium]
MRRIINVVMVHILLVAGAIVFLFPFLWMLSTALKPIDQVMTLPPRWVPKPILWHNFIKVFKTVP